MAAPVIGLIVRGVDGTSNAFDKINARIEAFSKQTQQRINAATAPFRRLQASMAKFSDVSGLNRIVGAVRNLARAGADAYQKVGQIVPLIGIIGGVASVAGVTRMVNAWTELGSRIGFAAQRIGISTDRLSGLQGAARLAGASAEGMTSGLQTLGQTMYDAIGGRAPEAIVMFRTLGIAFQDASGHARSVTEVLPEVADKIKAIRDPFAQAQVAAALFGGAAEELLPFLRKGSDGIREYTDMARRYGVFSETAAAAANRLRESQAKVSLAVEGLRNKIAERLEPVLTPMLAHFAEWLATSPQVTQAVEWLGGKVEQLGRWIEGGGIERFGDTIQGWLQPIGIVAHALGGDGGTLGALELLATFMAGTFALKVIAPWLLLATRIASVTRAVALFSTAVGAFSPPAWLAYIMGAGGAAAGKMNVPMVDDFGRPVGNWGGAQGQQAAEQAANQPREPFVPLATMLWRKLFGGGGAGGSGAKPGGQTSTFDTTMTPQARGLLDTIAGTESPGYNVEYGGKRFSDYSRHPNEANPILSGPNAGQTSTAAGRYQFLTGTWNEAAAATGAKDFSPASQDKAAWWLAQRDYARRTGRDLSTDLKSDDPKIRAGIGQALHGTWTSLPGGIEAGTNNDRFSTQLSRNTQREAMNVPAAHGDPMTLNTPGANDNDSKSTVRLEFAGKLPDGVSMRMDNPQKVDVSGPLVERPQLLGAMP